jgi:sugar phosphate isomerase/epimerase
MSIPAIFSGLTSVTFRKLPCSEIIRLAAEAHLDGIEWGGDVHVPPGDTDKARRIAAQTRDAGLKNPSYGSYYRLGVSPKEDGDRVLDSAVALGASIVRVWAGNIGSADATDAFRIAVTKDAQEMTERAASQGLRIACEWHGGTLTDTLESAQRLLTAVDHPVFGTYWQPRNGQPVESRLSDLRIIAPRLMGVHVFHWGANGERQPLEDGKALWQPCLREIARVGLPPLFAHLEFVPNDDSRQFRDDAATLRQWITTSIEEK